MHGTLPIRLTYKTAEELGFVQEQWNALAWFVDQYDAGRIQDAPGYVKKTWPPRLGIVPQWFDMYFTNSKGECGTAGCIYGWIGHRIQYVPDNFDPRIGALFNNFPRGTTAADARDATVRVLRGEPAWATE